MVKFSDIILENIITMKFMYNILGGGGKRGCSNVNDVDGGLVLLMLSAKVTCSQQHPDS